MLPPPPVSRTLPRVHLQLPPPPAKAIEAEMSMAPTKADSKCPVPQPAATSHTKKQSARQDGFKSAMTMDSSEEEAMPPKKGRLCRRRRGARPSRTSTTREP